MIVDCHTHVWQSPEQLGLLVLGEPPRSTRTRSTRGAPGDRATVRAIPAADVEYHWSQTEGVDKSFVLAFKSRYLRAEIPNRYVADYVRRYPDRLVGLAGIDPTDASAVDELRLARAEMGMRGLTLSPANQDFHPVDTRAMRIYEAAEELGMFVLIHPGSPYAERSKMEFARPVLLDEVARSFPRLRIVIAQLGWPWVDETLCLLGKHPGIFADISGLMRRPWQAYNALASACEYGVIDKLLFGSDFPYSSAKECIEALYSINQMVHGTNLPIVPRESLRSIVERDAMSLLGLV